MLQEEFVVNKSSDIGEKKKGIGNIEMDRRTFLKAMGMLGAAHSDRSLQTKIVKSLENLDSGKNNVCVLVLFLGRGRLHLQ
jgi:Ni,Fe-hydrogenase I small subunit